MGFAWSCPIDTHNDVRFAVDALSGDDQLLKDIYRRPEKNVSQGIAAHPSGAKKERALSGDVAGLYCRM